MGTYSQGGLPYTNQRLVKDCLRKWDLSWGLNSQPGEEGMEFLRRGNKKVFQYKNSIRDALGKK